MEGDARLSELNTIFKAYDIRGKVGETINDVVFYTVGKAFVEYYGLEGATVIVGRDMRESGEGYAEAFMKGCAAAGVMRIINLGETSTDALYYASGLYNASGAMFTASHNPSEYNGLKLCLPGALGVSLNTGLEEVKQLAAEYLKEENPMDESLVFVENMDILPQYSQKLRELSSAETHEGLKIVTDAANGMAGLTIPAVFNATEQQDALPHEIIDMFFELDGAFPNHPADPLNPKNLKDVQAKVKETKANLGLAFDGDADRCVIIDEKGKTISPSIVSSIIVETLSKTEPDGTILYSALTSREFKETIEANGYTPVRIKVGHSPAKQTMKETGALFAGEHSGHYYFKDFYGADTGMLAALMFIKTMSDTGLKASELAAKHDVYHQSGELNFTVSDPSKLVGKIKTLFETHNIEHYDGVTVSHDENGVWWWVNVRPSNTEPLVRLNVESNHELLMRQMRELLIDVIKTCQ